MTIRPYVFKALSELTLEDRCHHLAAFNKITVAEFGENDSEFPWQIKSLELEQRFKDHVNDMGGNVKVCDVVRSAYDWLQAADPDGMSDRFIEWQEACVRKERLVRLSCHGTDRFYDAEEIRKYLATKGL